MGRPGVLHQNSYRPSTPRTDTWTERAPLASISELGFSSLSDLSRVLAVSGLSGLLYRAYRAFRVCRAYRVDARNELLDPEFNVRVRA